MPLPDKTPPREPLRQRPLSSPRLGPSQEHDNLYASRNDVGQYSCVAMFEAIVRQIRSEPNVQRCFTHAASDYMERKSTP